MKITMKQLAENLQMDKGCYLGFVRVVARRKEKLR
jgi:hypothetical protein